MFRAYGGGLRGPVATAVQGKGWGNCRGVELVGGVHVAVPAPAAGAVYLPSRFAYLYSIVSGVSGAWGLRLQPLRDGAQMRAGAAVASARRGGPTWQLPGG